MALPSSPRSRHAHRLCRRPAGAALMLALGLAATPRAIAGPQYLRNGSFERGFAFWTDPGDGAFAYVLTQPYGRFARRQGRGYALLGARGTAREIAQTVQTTPGEMLVFSFALAGDGGTPASFTASFNGRALLALTDMPAFVWRPLVFRVQATGRDTVSFAFRNDTGYWALDAVSLHPLRAPPSASAAALAAPIPEPPAWLLLLSAGFAFAAVQRWRRRRPG